jgi:hypothetical protein
MASQVQICNQALTKLGAQRITDLVDDTRNARVMNAIYTAKRDAELAANPWTFAIKRARLPASSTAPAFGWARSFPLPTDFLRLVEVGQDYVFYDDDQTLFVIESDPATGRPAILTDQASPLNIRYVYRVTNPGLHPALFDEAFACRLAAEACEEITQNLSKREAAWGEHRQALRSARRVNAIEQPPQNNPNGSWVQTLLQG